MRRVLVNYENYSVYIYGIIMIQKKYKTKIISRSLLQVNINLILTSDYHHIIKRRETSRGEKS